MPKKKLSRSKIVKKLDAIFSRYIRKKNSKNNLAKCFTCGKVDEWKYLQCGHFQSRRHYATRWDEVIVKYNALAVIFLNMESNINLV